MKIFSKIILLIIFTVAITGQKNEDYYLIDLDN